MPERAFILACVVFGALCGWASGARTGVGAAAPPAVGAFDARATLDEANAEFARAVELAGRDGGDAREAAAHAARAGAAYREVALQTGVGNHRLELNIGNASLLAGDVGHAVAAFRRAERISPRDADVRASLGAARARVGVRLEPDVRARAWDVMLAWRGRISRDAMLGVALAGYAWAWGLAAWRLDGRGRGRGWAGVVVGVLALCAAGLLAADDWDRRSSRDAVVVAPEVVGRSGPGEGLYEPSFKQPLRAGVECRVVEERGAWSKVRLIDGRETWVPGATVERLGP